MHKPIPANEIIAISTGGCGKDARFEQATSTMERTFKKHGAGLFGDGSGCKCSSDVIVQPVNLLEAAGKSENDGCVKRGQRVYCY
jgi:hypothetical protein